MKQFLSNRNPEKLLDLTMTTVLFISQGGWLHAGVIYGINPPLGVYESNNIPITDHH